MLIKNVIKKTFSLMNLDIKRLNTVPVTYFETEEYFNKLYGHAQIKTQMFSTDNLLRKQRHYTLHYLLKQIDTSKGHIAECGCWRGLSAYQTAAYLASRNFKNSFYIFDSFEGLSEFQEYDIQPDSTQNLEERRKEFACPLDIVRENLKEFDFIEYKRGWIPERFSDVAGDKFIFVHIDVDLYQPIKDSLEFFYDRMVKDGIIVFDDYGFIGFPGAKKAVDELLADKKDFFLPLPSGQAFLIKR